MPPLPQTATYRHAFQQRAKRVVSVFPLSVTPGWLLNGLPDFSLSFPTFRSPFQSGSHIPVAIYVPQQPTLHDSAHSLFHSPASPSLLSWVETESDSVRLKGSVLRCNLTVAFLGSPLSVSSLLPWLPVKSMLCLFVTKLFFFFPLRRLCVKWRRLMHEGKCWHLLHKLSHTPSPLLALGALMKTHLVYNPTHRVLKHNTCSALHVIHRGCLVLVCVTLQSRHCKVSRSISDWVRHRGIIMGEPVEWSGGGKDKESDMRRQGRSWREWETFKESDFYQGACNKWERWLQWQPPPSGMETAVYTVQCIEWDISSVTP